MSNDSDDEFARIVDAMNKRGNAAMFAGGNKDKQHIERQAAEEWASSMAETFGLEITNVRSSDNDPPDCYATLAGKTISIEMTELVDGDLLRKIDHARQAGHTANSSTFFNDVQWTPSRLWTAIEKGVDDKDRKYAARGLKFDFLVMYTDEDWLSPQLVEATLKQRTMAPRGAFSAAYLLRTHFPGYSEHWPVFELYRT